MLRYCRLILHRRVDRIYESASNARALLIPCRSDHQRIKPMDVIEDEEDLEDYANHALQGSPIKFIRDNLMERSGYRKNSPQIIQLAAYSAVCLRDRSRARC
jgi:hypothetical protein